MSKKYYVWATHLELGDIAIRQGKPMSKREALDMLLFAFDNHEHDSRHNGNEVYWLIPGEMWAQRNDSGRVLVTFYLTSRPPVHCSNYAAGRGGAKGLAITNPTG